MMVGSGVDFVGVSGLVAWLRLDYGGLLRSFPQLQRWYGAIELYLLQLFPKLVDLCLSSSWFVLVGLCSALKVHPAI